MNLQRHCTSNEPTDIALQMNLQRHCTSNEPTDIALQMNLQRHCTSTATSAIHCLYVVVFSFSTISVDFFIWSTICNTNAVTESVTCPANRQVKFVPLADHMVWYSIIAAYPTPMWLRGMQCVPLYDHVYLLVSIWTVSVLVTVYAAASFCMSVHLCVPGYSPQPPKATAPLPQEGRAGGQRLGLGGTPGQVAR